jgi:hypothetical protein
VIVLAEKDNRVIGRMPGRDAMMQCVQPRRRMACSPRLSRDNRRPLTSRVCSQAMNAANAVDKSGAAAADEVAAAAAVMGRSSMPTRY